MRKKLQKKKWCEAEKKQAKYAPKPSSTGRHRKEHVQHKTGGILWRKTKAAYFLILMQTPILTPLVYFNRRERNTLKDNEKEKGNMKNAASCSSCILNHFTGKEKGPTTFYFTKCTKALNYLYQLIENVWPLLR